MKTKENKNELVWHHVEQEALTPTHYLFLLGRRNGKIFGSLLAAILIIFTLKEGSKAGFYLELNCLGIGAVCFLLRSWTELRLRLGRYTESIFTKFYGKSGLSIYEKNEPDVRRARAFFSAVTVPAHFFDLYIFFILPAILRNRPLWNTVVLFIVLLFVMLLFNLGMDYSIRYYKECLRQFPFNNTVMRILCFVAGFWGKRVYGPVEYIFDMRVFSAGMILPFLLLFIPAVGKILTGASLGYNNPVNNNKLFDVSFSFETDLTWDDVERKIEKDEKEKKKKEYERERERREDERRRREWEERDRRERQERLRREEEKKQQALAEARRVIKEKKEEDRYIKESDDKAKLSSGTMSSITTDRTRSVR
ncbi:MAG: hypothetical protein K6G10_04780 [Butyrivibrio sp.]|nr:hypothetical protein [Butyrivibrio sp.]